MKPPATILVGAPMSGKTFTKIPMAPAPHPLREEPTLEQNLRKLDFWNWVGIAACVFGIIVLLVFNHYCPNVK